MSRIYDTISFEKQWLLEQLGGDIQLFDLCYDCIFFPILHKNLYISFFLNICL